MVLGRLASVNSGCGGLTYIDNPKISGLEMHPSVNMHSEWLCYYKLIIIVLVVYTY